MMKANPKKIKIKIDSSSDEELVKMQSPVKWSLPKNSGSSTHLMMGLDFRQSINWWWLLIATCATMYVIKIRQPGHDICSHDDDSVL